MVEGDNYPRDMVGYGRTPPDPKWPGGARVAIQFVINYEEGGEICILHGEAASEAFLSEIVGAEPFEGTRLMSMESLYKPVRIWQSRGILAPASLVRVARSAGNGVWNRHGHGAEPRRRCRHDRIRLGNREPWLALDRL
jgi:hypothetical protein